MDPERYASTIFGEPRRLPGQHGYVAYFPAAIPRQLDLPASTVRLLADAEAALGRLAGSGAQLPDPDLLIQPYLMREALSSTRIEGTRASLVEVLKGEASDEPPSPDVEEVLNYVTAMQAGLGLLVELPLSTRLVRQIHETLMMGVRGKDLAPGALRTSQNWIGPPGSTIETAPYVPPPPAELAALLTDWERFANERTVLPILIQDALLHSQFETIHPFLDGNGRLGRLIVVLFLVAHGRLPAPLLYLSAFLEVHRDRYYAALQSMRESGDPIPWLDLFLTAVQTQAEDAVDRAGKIIDVRERYREVVGATSSPNMLGLVEMVSANPFVNARAVEQRLGVSRPTALRLLKTMESSGVLRESEEGARGQRRYIAYDMLAALRGFES